MEPPRIQALADGRVLVVLGGESELGSPELLGAIEKAAEDVSPHLVLDLTDIESIDSTGLRFFMNVHRLLEARGGRLGLVNPSEPVLYLLTLTRLDTFFAVESTAGGNGA